MKKFRVMVALTAVLTLLLSVTVLAATSPSAGVSGSTSNSSSKSEAAPAPVVPAAPSIAGVSQSGAAVSVKPITDKGILTVLASSVMAQAQAVGGTPQVIGSADIQAPAGYTGGAISLTLTAAGIVPGDQAYAAHLMANGQTEIVALTAGNGVVAGTFNGLSPVTIFKVVGASAAPAASSGLHQTGSVDYTVFFLALAIISGSILFYAAKRYSRA